MSPGDNEPVAVVVSRRVRPGCQAAYEVWLNRVIVDTAALRGCLGAQIK